MQSAKATGSPADPLVVVAVSFISQDRFVTKWASCEYHLGTTYLKLAAVPWQPAWQRGEGNKLHHLLNMHLTLCPLKAHD